MSSGSPPGDPGPSAAGPADDAPANSRPGNSGRTSADRASAVSTSAGSRLPSSRRFVALPIPAEVRERLAASLPQDPDLADGVRWTRPDGWHLTVAFLGDVEDRHVDQLIRTLEVGVATTTIIPKRLAVGELGTFGRRVLWIGVDPSPEGSLQALADAVRTALRRGGFPVDNRPMRPHVTLARAGRRPVSRAIVEATAAVTPDRSSTLAWKPNAIDLWRSQLGDGPARYTTEATIPL